MEELLHRVGPVQVRALVIAPGHILQGRKTCEHRCAGAPGTHHHERPLGGLGVYQPCGPLDAEEREEVVDVAVCRVEHPYPDHGRRDHGDYRRKEEDRPGCRAQGEASVRDQCQQQCDEKKYRSRDERIEARVTKALVEPAVAEKLSEVVKPNPFGIRNEAELREAVVEGHDQRIDAQKQESDDPWKREEESVPVVPCQSCFHLHPSSSPGGGEPPGGIM